MRRMGNVARQETPEEGEEEPKLSQRLYVPSQKPNYCLGFEYAEEPHPGRDLGIGG